MIENNSMSDVDMTVVEYALSTIRLAHLLREKGCYSTEDSVYRQALICISQFADQPDKLSSHSSLLLASYWRRERDG